MDFGQKSEFGIKRLRLREWGFQSLVWTMIVGKFSNVFLTMILRYLLTLVLDLTIYVKTFVLVLN